MTFNKNYQLFHLYTVLLKKKPVKLVLRIAYSSIYMAHSIDVIIVLLAFQVKLYGKQQCRKLIEF